MQDGNRRYGRPRTNAQRRARHKKLYGTSKLPPRGTGLKYGPEANPEATYGPEANPASRFGPEYRKGTRYGPDLRSDDEQLRKYYKKRNRK